MVNCTCSSSASCPAPVPRTGTDRRTRPMMAPPKTRSSPRSSETRTRFGRSTATSTASPDHPAARPTGGAGRAGVRLTAWPQSAPCEPGHCPETSSPAPVRSPLPTPPARWRFCAHSGTRTRPVCARPRPPSPAYVLSGPATRTSHSSTHFRPCPAIPRSTSPTDACSSIRSTFHRWATPSWHPSSKRRCVQRCPACTLSEHRVSPLGASKTRHATKPAGEVSNAKPYGSNITRHVRFTALIVL